MRTKIIKCTGETPLNKILTKPCRFVSLWRSSGDGIIWSDTGLLNNNGELFWEGQHEKAVPSDFDWLIENGNYMLLVDYD